MVAVSTPSSVAYSRLSSRLRTVNFSPRASRSMVAPLRWNLQPVDGERVGVGLPPQNDRAGCIEALRRLHARRADST